MADGYNKKFLADPIDFINKYDYNVYDSSRPTFPDNDVYDIDFVKGTYDMLLEQYSNREHHRGAVPVHAYYLCAKLNSASEMVISDEANYLFTPILSGCAFAVYGNNRNEVTAVHINDYDNKSFIAERINDLLNEGHAFCKILCESEDAKGIKKDPNVLTYNYNASSQEETLVFGMRDGLGNWHFYKKRFKVNTGLEEIGI